MSKEKQTIEEMAKIIREADVQYAKDRVKAIEHDLIEPIPPRGTYIASKLYDAGCRKQSEGCKFCGTPLYIKVVQNTMPLLAPLTRADELRYELLNLTGERYLLLEAKFCPICGAKMKGDDD